MIETIISTCGMVISFMRENVLFSYGGVRFTPFNIACGFLILNTLFNMFFGGSDDD